jgi:hypothetical protein
MPAHEGLGWVAPDAPAVRILISCLDEDLGFGRIVVSEKEAPHIF